LLKAWELNMTAQPKNLLKYIVIVIGFIGLVVLLKSVFTPHKSKSTKLPVKSTLTSVADTASGDTSNETLKAISAQIHQVSEQNKQIIARDNKLQQETQQMVQREIQTQMQQINQQAQRAQNATSKTTDTTTTNKNTVASAQYPIGENTNSASSVSSTATDLHLTWVDDMQNSLSSLTNTAPNSLHPSAGKEASSNHYPVSVMTAHQKNTDDTNKPIPRYTIPANSVLANTTTMTGLIGRIPIDGVVRDPYSFLLIVGPKNLAANNTYMPDVAEVMVSGTATGDMALSCVRGTITSLTFVFQDGTISTYPKSDKDNKEGQGNTLGYLADTHGNPCINGKFYTNAPEYLTGTVLLGGAKGAAGAFSAEQTTSSTNAFGGQTSSVTGSSSKYVLGQAGMDAASQAQQWWNQREKNSFDAVYVAPIDESTGGPREIALIVTQEIPIDYNPVGRKVAYDVTQANSISRRLD